MTGICDRAGKSPAKSAPAVLKTISTHARRNLLRFGVLFVCSLFFPLACSDRMPAQSDFIDWLSARYAEEMDDIADEIVIYRWERTSKNITRLAPEIDGLRVEAAIFSISDDVPQVDGDEPLVHYVFCRYYLVTDEWYLHASSWGSGFWKQDPNEWGHLVEKCQRRAEQIAQQKDIITEGE